MKQSPVLLGCALAFALALLSTCAFGANPPAKAAAPAKEKALTPQQLRQLVNQNNNAVRKATQELSSTCRDGKKLGEGLKEKALADAKALLAFLQIPEEEGKPSNLTPSSAHRQIGEAFSNPLNLRLLKEARDHFAEAIRLAATPEERAEAVFANASLAIRSYQEGAVEKSRKEIEALLKDEKVPARLRLTLAKRAVDNDLLPEMDFLAVGWEIARPAPEAHDSYYYLAIDFLTVARRQLTNKLEDRYSEEKTIELCDRAIADPAFRHKSRFIATKAGTLREMRRYDEAEQFLLEHAASTNLTIRHDVSLILGDFYVKRAERYYDAPHRPTMEKAIAAFVDAKLAWPKDSRPLHKIAETSLAIEDFDRSIEAYEEVVRLEHGTNRWVAIRLGEAYFGKKDWEKAAFCYGMQADYLPAKILPNYCRSLFALGRYEEAAENLRRYEKKGYAGQKDEARYLLSKVEEILAREAKAE